MADQYVNAKELTEEDVMTWLRSQQASTVGRGFSVDDERGREAFTDWFMKVYHSALETRDG